MKGIIALQQWAPESSDKIKTIMPGSFQKIFRFLVWSTDWVLQFVLCVHSLELQTTCVENNLFDRKALKLVATHFMFSAFRFRSSAGDPFVTHQRIMRG